MGVKRERNGALWEKKLSGHDWCFLKNWLFWQNFLFWEICIFLGWDYTPGMPIYICVSSNPPKISQKYWEIVFLFREILSGELFKKKTTGTPTYLTSAGLSSHVIWLLFERTFFLLWMSSSKGALYTSPKTIQSHPTQSSHLMHHCATLHPSKTAFF